MVVKKKLRNSGWWQCWKMMAKADGSSSLRLTDNNHWKIVVKSRSVVITIFFFWKGIVIQLGEGKLSLKPLALGYIRCQLTWAYVGLTRLLEIVVERLSILGTKSSWPTAIVEKTHTKVDHQHSTTVTMKTFIKSWPTMVIRGWPTMIDRKQ